MTKTYIRFLHAVPNTTAVDIYVNNSLLSSKNIYYQGFSNYYDAAPGIYNIKIFPADRKDVPLVDELIELMSGVIYTLALTGYSNNMSISLIGDKKINIDKNKSYLRFINLSPSGTGFDISLNNDIKIKELIFKEVTSYETLKPSNYFFRARDSVNDSVKISSPQMLLKPGKMYAVYIVGIDGGNPELQILVPLEGATYLI